MNQGNLQMHKTIGVIKKLIIKNYGKKCPDYNPLCAVCIMWHAFETIKEGLEFDKPLKKKKK